MEGVTTPSNIEYMILGYAAAGVIMLLLVVSMVLRARRMRAEAEMLEKLAEDDKPEA
jgi:hypothetical protein